MVTLDWISEQIAGNPRKECDLFQTHRSHTHMPEWNVLAMVDVCEFIGTKQRVVSEGEISSRFCMWLGFDAWHGRYCNKSGPEKRR